MEFEIFETLKAAYDSSTPAHNRFREALESICWDSRFYADGEYYFVRGGFCFTTPSLDPFQIRRDWKPEAKFTDGAIISF